MCISLVTWDCVSSFSQQYLPGSGTGCVLGTVCCSSGCRPRCEMARPCFSDPVEATLVYNSGTSAFSPSTSSFMVFNALGALPDISSSYTNMRAATIDANSTIASAHSNDPKTYTSPLLFLLLLVFSAGLQVLRFVHPR
ncbi:hypothetical protein D9619_002327 [Psilocybe cf. subviscida]|uniref:Uncharacterized protein n=1 Tax=Psilocybe cf. subviscida TaxID=2480587 RepID=A0A8H5AXM2_9AGAR|nr:hypothetical protein D9619_002327 [Psilocybe cf. subviscida]